METTGVTAEYVPQATDDAEAIQLVKHEHIDEALLDNQALSENKGGGERLRKNMYYPIQAP